MEQDVRRFLGSLQPIFDLAFRAVTDSYGYMWIVFEGKRIEVLLADLTATGDILAEEGSLDQLLGAVLEFANEGHVRHEYLIYNYKRNNYSPFVPTDSKSRDTEPEMK